MTKRIKAKKELSRDFKKKKVKLGKKLKKADNETKTEFKARKLIIREQLEERQEYDVLNRRKLNIKELCIRLTNKNNKIRVDALKCLKAAIVEQERSQISSVLSQIVTGVAPCVLEISGGVRKEANKTLEALVQKMKLALEPYFHILSSYVCCSMVHINENVRMDSLFLMDILIVGLPSLIAKSADNLLENYLSLISKKIRSSNVQNASIVKPLQHFDPNSQVSTLQWRTNLLESLCRYLSAIISEKDLLKKNAPKSLWETILKNVDEKYDPHRTSNNLKIISDVETLKDFCERLLPVFITLWADALSDVSNIEDNPLPMNGARVLQVILKLLSSLMQLSRIVSPFDKDTQWLKEMVNKQLRTKLLAGFPYSVISRNPESELKVENINISVCTFSLQFSKSLPEVRKPMVKYLQQLLLKGSEDGNYNLEEMVNIICNLISKDGVDHKEQHEKLLAAALVCFERQKMGSRGQIVMLRIPLQMTEHTCLYFRGTAVSVRWMKAVMNAAKSSGEDACYDLLDQFGLRAMPGFTPILKELIQDVPPHK